MPESHVWLICLVGRTRFPNLSVLGVYTAKEKLFEAMRSLPRESTYNLYKVPLDQFVGFWDKNGQLQDGMGRLRHWHLTPPVPEESDEGFDRWESLEHWLENE